MKEFYSLPILHRPQKSRFKNECLTASNSQITRFWNLIHFSFCVSLYDFNTDQFITDPHFSVAIWAKDLSEESLSLSIKPCYFLANLWHWSLMAFLVLSVYVVIWQLDMVSASHELKTDNQSSSLTIRTQFLTSSGNVLSLQLLYIYLPIILFQWDSASHISTYVISCFLTFLTTVEAFARQKRLLRLDL